MPLVTTKEMFRKAIAGHYAIGAFNINNHDQLKAVLQAAENQKSPVILAFSSGGLQFFGLEYLRAVCEVASKIYSIPFALHLDHGKSVELCKQCIDAGFTSVMIDASSYDYEENIRMTKEVVAYAHARDVVVESELGAIAGIEDDVSVEDGYGSFTHPDQAEDFVKRTGIDSLAIAIGTAHGAYKFKPGQKPQLRFDILKEVVERLPGFPIVLHGASSIPHAYLEVLNNNGGAMPEAIGIPESMLREAAASGVAKINVGSDLRVAYTGYFRKAAKEQPEQMDERKFIKPACDAITKLVEDKMANVMGSAGHAND